MSVRMNEAASAKGVENALRRVWESIEGWQFSMTNEKTLQCEIAERLEDAEIDFERECRLEEFGTIDFFIEGLGVEIKIKGAKRAIFRQCQRYCRSPVVKALLLVTNVSMGVPEEINGKPVYVFSLSRSHL